MFRYGRQVMPTSVCPHTCSVGRNWSRRSSALAIARCSATGGSDNSTNAAAQPPTCSCRPTVWARMQVELLNRKRWNTRLELANAIFEYLEIFHNRQRRHSSLGMRTPVEYEML